MSPQDIALIQRWTESKDPDAFTEIVNRYSGLVYGASLRVLRNRSDAEDVAQECLMRIVEAPTHVESSLGGWLHTVATRRALTRLRGDKRRAAREKTFAEGQPIAAEAVWDDLQHMIDDVIAGLPEKLQVPVVEHYLLGRTLESIGNDLGVSRQAVSRRLQRGVERIRTTLREKGIPITGAALTTGFAEIAKAAASDELRKGLLNAAIAGIDSNTLVQLISKPLVSWFAAPIAAASIVALVVLGVQVSKNANETSMVSAPPMPVNATAPPVLLDEEPSEPASFIVAQAETEESDSNAVENAAVDPRTPDFTEFSLERPLPKPGVGSLYYYFFSPDAIGAEVTITYVNWKPWEKVPPTRLTYTRTVPESRMVSFKNLPLGTYHAEVFDGAIGTRWFNNLSEGFTGEHNAFPLWPMVVVEFLIVNEEGEPLSGAEVIPYQSQAVGGVFPFGAMPGLQRQTSKEGSVIIPNAVPGIFKVMVKAPGYAMTSSEWIDSERGPHTVVLTEGGAFECRVVDESGKAMEDVIVHLQGAYYRDHAYSRTDSEGLAHMMFLRPVDYKVRVYSENYVLNGPPVQVSIEEGGLASIGDLEVRLGTEIRGRVYDAETGLGIPGIRLSVHAAVGVAIDDLVTDDEGYYAIPNASEDQYMIQRHDSGGYGAGAGASIVQFTVTADGIEGEANFALTRGIRASGRVVDTDGRPVIGAMIRSGYSGDNLEHDTLSDRQGRFRLARVREPGEIYVRVQAAGYGRKTFGPFEVPKEGRNDLVFTLPQTAYVSGRILVDGRDAPPRTWLFATPSDSETEGVRTGSGRIDTYSGDMSGHYILDSLTSGTFNLSVRPPGSSEGAVSATVTVEEGQILEDVIVEYNSTGLSLTGFVVDRGGVPIEFAQVSAIGQYGSNLQGRTAGNGTFAFLGLSDSHYVLQARHADHSSVKLDAVEAGQRNVRLMMPDRGSVIGTVVAATDRDPITRFRVERVAGLLETPLLSKPSGLTIGSDTGSFKLSDMEIGDWTLVIWADGLAPAFVHVANVQENRTTNVGTVSLQPATLLRGRITSADGAPVSGAVIHNRTAYFGRVSSQNSFARSDSDGRFEIDSFPEGVYELSVGHSGYAPTPLSVRLVSGQTTEADVTLYGGGALEGIVYAGGVAQPGSMLQLEPIDGTMGTMQAASDANGHYEFTRVPAGEYTVRAIVPSIDGETYVSEEYQVVFDNFGTQILDWTF